MESDLQQRPPIFHDHQPQQQKINSGLTRYRSAPSSYFTNIIDKEFYEHIFNRPSSPETERVFSRFMNSFDDDDDGEEPLAQNLSPVAQITKVKVEVNQQAKVMPSMNDEPLLLQQQQHNDSINNFYQSSARPPLPNQRTSAAYPVGIGNTSNLIRHSSSPPGLFSQINIENDYAGMRDMASEEARFSPARLMSSIAEIGDKSSRENSEAFAERQDNDFVTGLAWDDEAKTFSGLSAAETQNETGSDPAAPLAHHLSLPKTSTEMAAIEKLLHFSDSVPCKIRAKRGCATHPRSIAERVRRTKISERMRKLQDLVPNMDKQTNTADMLDLAVEYIKDLQKQVQTLTDSQAKCTCSQKQHQ